MAARFTQADLVRAIRGAQKAGVEVTRIVITPAGGIEMFFADWPVEDADDWRRHQPGLKDHYP